MDLSRGPTCHSRGLALLGGRGVLMSHIRVVRRKLNVQQTYMNMNVGNLAFFMILYIRPHFMFLTYFSSSYSV